MKKNYFAGAITFLALAILIFALGVPAALVYHQLGYAVSLGGALFKFNLFGFIALLIAVYFYVKDKGNSQ